MPKDHSPLPVDETGNGDRLRTLVLDEADAFMLAYAVMIASNSSLSDAPIAVRRLNHYKEAFLAMAPPEAKLLRNDTDLCEIAIAMADAESFTIHRKLPRYAREGRSVVTIGRRTWATRDSIDAETHRRLVAMLGRIAPIGCTPVEGDDEESAW